MSTKTTRQTLSQPDQNSFSLENDTPNPKTQVQQLEWVREELIQLQNIHLETLRTSPHLKDIIFEVDSLMLNLFTLIQFAIKLAKQVYLYYFDNAQFDMAQLVDLLEKVEHSQKVILNQIQYLISYYNELVEKADQISDQKNKTLPLDTHRYIKTLKRYIDTHLGDIRRELHELRHLEQETIQSLSEISSFSEHTEKQLYIEIQRVISRVVKCYIALASHTNVQVDKTVITAHEIIEEEENLERWATPQDGIDPYEALCEHYAAELEELVSHMQWTHHLLNRFLLPKLSDYIPSASLPFSNFFEKNTKLLDAFTEFVTKVFQVTREENPCRPQTEVVGQVEWERGQQVIKNIVRDREIMMIMSDTLPYVHKLVFQGKSREFVKGTEFVIKFGVTYFDMNKALQYRGTSEPMGYIQLFLHHSLMIGLHHPEVHELYVGQEVYLSLDEEQAHSWRHTILLALISLGLKYEVKPSKYLQGYLVKILKKR